MTGDNTATFEISQFLQERSQYYKREAITAIIGFAVMMVYVFFGNWIILRVVAMPIALIRLLGALRLHSHRRSLATIGCSGGGDASKLYELVELDVAFLKSSFYWYATPLGFGLSGIALAVWWHARSYWIAGACLTACVVVILGSRSMNNRTIRSIQSRVRAPSITSPNVQ